MFSCIPNSPSLKSLKYSVHTQISADYLNYFTVIYSSQEFTKNKEVNLLFYSLRYNNDIIFFLFIDMYYFLSLLKLSVKIINIFIVFGT